MSAVIQTLKEVKNPTLHTYTSQVPAAQIKRGLAYSISSPVITLQVLTHTLGGAALGGAVGIAVGAGLAAAICPAAMVPAVDIAGAAGMVIGGCLGARSITVQISQSPEYQSWVAQGVNNTGYKLRGDLCADPRLNEFRCPITKTLIGIPVKDSHGRIWEHELIMKHIQTHGGIKAPHPTNPQAAGVTKDELVFDIDYHKKVQAKLNEVAENPAAPSAVFTNAVAVYKQMVNVSRAEVCHASVKTIFTLLGEKVIKEEDALKAIKGAMDQFTLKA